MRNSRAIRMLCVQRTLCKPAAIRPFLREEYRQNIKYVETVEEFLLDDEEAFYTLEVEVEHWRQESDRLARKFGASIPKRVVFRACGFMLFVPRH